MAAEPEVRRASDPRVIIKLHSAIKKTCEQKQCPIFERIQRALTINKVQITRSRIETQLKNAIRDGLIIESNGGNRGKSPSSSTTSEVKTSFRVPSLENFYENYEDDGHDWYCWVCHREGEVYLCSRCPRVIHRKCAELTQEDLEGEFICYCCNDLESTKQYGKKEIQELATMLSFTVDRMKSKCEELWKSPDEELHPTYRLFIYQDTSLNSLEQRVVKKEFDSLAKFHYEIEWLFHNAVIYFGGENKLTELARMVVLDGQNELSQIDICSECYLRSNQRMKNWYSIPCKPEHRIVYAKLGSDPPWPAKVLRENEDGSSIDVRFFGQPYQRAWIPKRSIWDLDVKPPLKKRSKALSVAEEELKIYLRLLTGSLNKSIKGNKSSSDSSEEEIDDDSDNNDQNSTKFRTKASKKVIPRSNPSTAKRGRPRSTATPKRKQVDSEDGDEEDDEIEEELDDVASDKSDLENESNSDNDSDDKFEPPSSKRSKNKSRGSSSEKRKRDEKDNKKHGGRKRATKRKSSPEPALLSGTPSGKETKAERRFREMQEKKMAEFQKTKGKGSSIKSFTAVSSKADSKVDINKNIGNASSDGAEEPSDMHLAQQIKMTDDYKMIEKLQERVRQLEKQFDTSQGDYESAQTDLESTRIDLASEKQKCKRLQEQAEKGALLGEEKLRNEMMARKQDEIDQAVEEERKRNELEFQSRMAEAIHEERAKGESKLQEALDKERVSLENKAKMIAQRDREEIQRNFDRYKNDLEVQHSRSIEKSKMEHEELTKQRMHESMRRIQGEAERCLAAAKKKSWCSNCTKEAFYHCCWNTNYCSTDCQRVHWVSHRYQCSREMMYTCRSCQQRQNFAGSFASQVPPK